MGWGASTVSGNGVLLRVSWGGGASAVLLRVVASESSGGGALLEVSGGGMLLEVQGWGASGGSCGMVAFRGLLPVRWSPAYLEVQI